MYMFTQVPHIWTWVTLFPKQLLSWMGFSILARSGLCSLMICWFLLVPAGVPVLVSLLISSFFPQDRGSVPSWFAGSSWFRLGFRCLSPFFPLLFSSRKGFCSVTICWFLLVPAGVPVLVSLLLSSFFPQDRGSVPSWFAGSSWFQLGFRCLSPLFSLLWFRCLSPFFSLLSFLRTGVLFHHDLLVPPGSGWGSGACLPPSLFFGSSACLFFLSSGKGFCSIMICWMGFRCLSPSFSLPQVGVLFHHDLLGPLGSGWGSGACLPSSLFFGSGACLHSSLFFLSSGQGFCSIMICWFLLVPAGVPVLVSLILSSLVPVLVSLLLSSFFFEERGSVPWFAGSSWFRLGFRCLSPSLFFGSGACLPSSLFLLSSGQGFCSIMICWVLLVPAGVPVLVSLLLSPLVPVLVSLLLSSFFFEERGSVPWFRLGFRCLSPSSLFFGSGACLPSSSLFFLSSGKGFCSIMIWATVSQMEASIFSSTCFTGSCVSLVGSHMGLCWRYCSQETTACTSSGLVWKLRTSILCGFLDAWRLFYCLVFVRLK